MNLIPLLPHVNAALNSVTIVLLLTGLFLIRTGRKGAHRKVMAATLVVSALFLVSYLIYHFSAPVFVFPGQGLIRPVYYTMLVSHVVLATVVTPMVALTAWRGLTGQSERHRPLARLTWPVWFYVAVTGVGIYLMLYHIYPSPGGV